MGDIQDFMALALRRSFAALREVSIRLDGDDLVIGFRAFGGFRPLALQGQEVVLPTYTLYGWRTIRGRLVYDPSQTRHGTWYKYRFLPNNPHEIFFVLDTDRCHWTNVERVVFDVQDGALSIRNRLFRPVGGQGAADGR